MASCRFGCLGIGASINPGRLHEPQQHIRRGCTGTIECAAAQAVRIITGQTVKMRLAESAASTKACFCASVIQRDSQYNN